MANKFCDSSLDNLFATVNERVADCYRVDMQRIP